MKGEILDFSVQENRGVISGADGQRYTFVGSEWKGPRPPSPGLRVDFEPDDKQAMGVYVTSGARTPGSKDKTVAGILGILLGGLGIHKFYLGFTGPGLVFLLTNTVGWVVTWLLFFIPNIALGVIGLVEGILYLTKSDEEFERLYVVEKKQWF